MTLEALPRQRPAGDILGAEPTSGATVNVDPAVEAVLVEDLLDGEARAVRPRGLISLSIELRQREELVVPDLIGAF